MLQQFPQFGIVSRLKLFSLKQITLNFVVNETPGNLLRTTKYHVLNQPVLLQLLLLYFSWIINITRSDTILLILAVLLLLLLLFLQLLLSFIFLLFQFPVYYLFLFGYCCCCCCCCLYCCCYCCSCC